LEPICESEEGDVYIGSTTQNYISHRLAEHVRNYKQWNKEKTSFTSSFLLFDKYGIDNVRIVLLELYPCHNNDELRARETYYQKQNKCVNNRMAFISKEEKLEYYKQYREEHRDKQLEYNKQYYNEHRDKKLEYNKQYREEHRDEISEKQKQYREEHRDELSEYNKQYHAEHREDRLEQMKQYREEYKQEISENKKEKITCECGREVRKYELKRHQRSDIHKKNLLLQLHDAKKENL